MSDNVNAKDALREQARLLRKAGEMMKQLGETVTATGTAIIAGADALVLLAGETAAVSGNVEMPPAVEAPKRGRKPAQPNAEPKAEQAPVELRPGPTPKKALTTDDVKPLLMQLAEKDKQAAVDALARVGATRLGEVKGELLSKLADILGEALNGKNPADSDNLFD